MPAALPAMASASILTNESEFDRQIATHWLTMRRSSNELLLTEPHPRQHPHRSAHCIEPSSHPGGPFHFHSANSLHSQFQTRNRSPNSFPESNSPADQRVRPINQLMMIKCWISSVCVCVCVCECGSSCADSPLEGAREPLSTFPCRQGQVTLRCR